MYLLTIQRVERGLRKEPKQRSRGLRRTLRSRKFARPEGGLRSPETGLRDEAECVPARIRPPS